MSFIKRAISSDEKLIVLTGIHWIYVAKGAGWFIAFLLSGTTIRYYLSTITLSASVPAFDIMGGYIYWIMSLIGGVLLFLHVLTFLSTEMGLTTKRVIYKTGIIATDVKEVDLEEIKAADVNNGWFGRFLNYGYVLFDARFVQNMNFPAMSKAFAFVRLLNKLRSELKADSMTVVLDNQSGQNVDVAQGQSQTQPAQETAVKEPKGALYKGLRNKLLSRFKTVTKRMKRKKVKAS